MYRLWWNSDSACYCTDPEPIIAGSSYPTSFIVSRRGSLKAASYQTLIESGKGIRNFAVQISNLFIAIFQYKKFGKRLGVELKITFPTSD